MRLTIIGGGGFRTPHVYDALLHSPATVDEVVLHDADAGRVDTMVRLLGEMAAGVEGAPRVRATTSLEDAIRGSDFIFTAIRVGGLAGRRADEHVALDLGVLGQETTGAGGLSYAIRTLPVMVRIAQLVAELAPHAYLLNFTNPAGIITEAMQKVLGDRVLGICDTPIGLGRRVAGLLGVPEERAHADYVGLNHLGWLRRVMVDGVDRLPELLADPERLGSLEEAKVFGVEWLRQLGAIPNEYLYYYYRNREALERIRESGMTRGDFLAGTQKDFFADITGLESGMADRWRDAVRHRSASYMAEALGGVQGAPSGDRHEQEDPADEGYAAVAVRAMRAIATGERSIVILNVRNGTAVPGIPEDAVVEVPALIDAGGVRPLAVAPPALHQIGLMQQIKAVERLVIEAAATGSRATAVTAFALHPLVDSVDVAARLVDGYIAAIPEVAAVLVRP